MSTVEGAGQREEGEYGRAAKRLKTEEREKEAEEREEGEEELEEGEDSDSGSLPGNVESAADNRARWSAGQYGAGRKVRRGKYYLTLPCSTASQAPCCHCVRVSIPYLSHCRLLHVSSVQHRQDVGDTIQANMQQFMHSNLRDELT